MTASHASLFGYRTFAFLALATAAIAPAQVTVTAPSANETLRAADDYPTLTFQDPWDMNQWTDLGWYTYGTDAPLSNLTNIAFSGGIFSATTTSTDPNFWLLDPYTPGSAQIGKNGGVFPIDSTKYRRFVIRMNLSGGGVVSVPNANQQGQFLWNLYFNQGTSAGFFTYAGWWIYSIDLPTLGAAAGSAWNAGPVGSLRLHPVTLPNVNVSVDWARLTADDPSLYRTITWTGAGAVDIFLDNDTNFANGYVGQIAGNVSGGSYQFFVGALPAGTYYVAIRPAGSSSNPSYSAGAWTVNDIPTLVFTSPSPTGSSDDFATTQMNDPFDMDSLTDIDYSVNVSGLAPTMIAARDEAGNNLGNVQVISGTTANNFSDPEVFPLYWLNRGATHSIDTSRYRILDLKWGILAPRNIFTGAIGRIVWKLTSENSENVSDDIILNCLPNANVIQHIVTDMKTLPLEPGGSPSTSGWTSLVNGFRLKSDEFPNAVNVFYQSLRLAAFEKADASYNIQWTYANQGTASPTVQLFYDTTGTGFNGTQIVSGLNPASGSYAWNTSGLGNGTYYIYARIVNGATVMNQTYARWPIVVTHGVSNATLALDHGKLNFGATNNGATVTSPQVVHVTTAAGVSWNVSSNNSAVVVSPTSGTGSGSFSVSVQSSTLPVGVLNVNVTVSSSSATNSPQIVQVAVNVINPSSIGSPFGSFDTPANGTTGIAGAIPVTGWALDNLEVLSLDIWREPITGETGGSNGLIFIGNAVFVEGARPDVAASYPSLPLNTRAGWGYLLLTNFLPNSSGAGGNGNGTYKLHAIVHSKTGVAVDLGAKTITVDNAHASKPFGAIDTPAQGGTASGSAYVNFGWALTQQPYIIPTDGSTVLVFIDGVQQPGHATYNNFRSDIATMFPGYQNSNGAVGYYTIDTTKFANAVHTIFWTATDNGGRADGLGSRYWTIFNGSGNTAPAEEAPGEIAGSAGRVTLRSGFDVNQEPAALDPDASGGYSVPLEELGRIEMQLGAVRGYQIMNRHRHLLPAGSTLRGGIFYWQPGPGFLGNYEFQFERADGTVVPVRVTIRPKQ